MRKILITLAVLMNADLTSSNALATILAKSNFATGSTVNGIDDEGWFACTPGNLGHCSSDTVYESNYPLGSYMVGYHSDPGLWYFVAPEKYTAKLSEAYQGSLSFRMNSDGTGAPNPYSYDVALYDAEYNDYLTTKLDSIPVRGPIGVWSDYSVALDSTTEWFSSLTGARATASDVMRVLETDPYLAIRGGYYDGLSYSAMTDVVLKSADSPPTTDLRYININSAGDISGESFNPGYPTVVVTHGWQPEADDPLSQSFPLSDVSQAVAARALEDGQSLNLITYQWAAAYTADTGGSDIFSGGTFIRYNAAAYGTKSAGNLLGNRLENLFEDSGYTGPVQMIGHSLGTAVNAWAVDYSSSLNVDQFTILDAPSDIPGAGCAADEQHCILPMQFTSDWFNSKLPEGQIGYVDNFYGSGQGFAPAMGTPILGAAGGLLGASGGEELTGANHTEVHEIYSERIRDDLFWTSPIFGLDNIHFLGRPGPSAWQPNPTVGLIVIGGELSDYSAWTATQGSVGISALSDLGISGTDVTNDVMVLNPNSPVSISHPFDIPIDAALLSFDFGFLDPGTGEFLQLYFDDILLWETPWMNALVGEVLNAVVPIGSLAGRSGDLIFLLDSITGDASARAFIANFEVMGVAALIADPVPEPGTLLLFGAGLLGLISGRRKMSA